MPGPTSHSYFSQRLRLHYLDWGNPGAPPLLLMHGNRDHAHNWDWTAERLQDRYHIIAPDLRGHGDSQWSAGSMYAPAEFVYDIAQLVHQQQLAPLRVVAHSLGGNIAMRFAGTFPDDVERLVVIEGWGGIVPGHQRPRAPERMRSWIEAQRSLAPRQPPKFHDACRRHGSLDVGTRPIAQLRRPRIWQHRRAVAHAQGPIRSQLDAGRLELTACRMFCAARARRSGRYRHADRQGIRSFGRSK